MPSAVMMKSVSVNYVDREVVFHVLIDNGVSEEHQKQLRQEVQADRHSVKFYVMDEKTFSNFPALGKVKTYITQATYYRLFIADVLSEEIQKVIYLDGDMIVRHSLDELWNANIENHAVGVVTDMALDSKDFTRLGYDEGYGYFNAGMLLINLNYWRKHHLKDTFLHLIETQPDRIVLHDQDVLNIILYNQKMELSVKFNCQNGFLMKEEYSEMGKWKNKYKDDIKSAVKDPVIVHYTDTIKPWHIEDSNPYGYEFMKYYKQTAWRYIKLNECGQSKLRHIAGKVLRQLGLLAPAKREHSKYYSLEDISKLK